MANPGPSLRTNDAEYEENYLNLMIIKHYIIRRIAIVK